MRSLGFHATFLGCFVPGAIQTTCCCIAISRMGFAFQMWMADMAMQVGKALDHGVGALSFGVELAGGQQSFPTGPTWHLYTGDDSRSAKTPCQPPHI